MPEPQHPWSLRRIVILIMSSLSFPSVFRNLQVRAFNLNAQRVTSLVHQNAARQIAKEWSQFNDPNQFIVDQAPAGLSVVEVDKPLAGAMPIVPSNDYRGLLYAAVSTDDTHKLLDLLTDPVEGLMKMS